MEKIAAVVVTHNRHELVKKTISALLRQTRSLDVIFVIDNDSKENVEENDPRIIVIRQENVGGSGGFFRGIKEAYEQGYDYMWCMDDDVFPREDCLERMLEVGLSGLKSSIGILCARRVMNGNTFITESKKVNLSNPFKNTFDYRVTQEELLNNEVVDIEGMSFEGALIKREVVDSIGLPNKDYFILYDDTDYSYRAVLAGYRVVLLRDALIDRYYFQSTLSYEEDKVRNKWKVPYHIRNCAYFCHKYGKNIIMRYCGALLFLFRMYGAITFNFFKGHKYAISDYFHYASMVKRGIKGELGKM